MSQSLAPADPGRSTAAPLHIAGVTLAVRDLAGTAAFYQQLLGLRPLPGTPADEVLLAAGDTPLLRLRHAPEARPETGREPGLFHTAFLQPSHAALGAWLRRAAGDGLKLQGASDHGVSSAIYLDDPEGNGIEVYADRPLADWPRPADGAPGIAMVTRPLDLRALAARGEAERPEGIVIGHVHLRAGALPRETAFYQGLGLSVMQQVPQASFLASGGYHHHVAVNTWRSTGRRPEGLTGLLEVELRARDSASFDRAAAALTAEAPVRTGENRVTGQDSAGIGLSISK